MSSDRPKNYSRWRAGCLLGVYLLMGAHIAHWKLSGRTLAPLELNEVMYTLELGIVTAGFVFMCLAVLSVLLFGRFFCGWGCHILALEDLCAWLLGKVHIRPKPVRSRVLLLVAPGAMFYMFIWPQVARLIERRSVPEWRVLGEDSGWASFVTDDFWRNLPGPGVTIATFLIVGFVIVYFLGTRSFCRYACPYGVIFALADRIAPGRIVAAGGCDGCGICTARCQSHIRVHEELTVFGRVVSPDCLRDLDCVAACPNEAIRYGIARPAGFRSWFRAAGVRRPRYDFTIGEDLLMAAVFVITLFVFRGLYGLVPFLLTLALGALAAYAAVLMVRLQTRPNVRFNNFQLRINGRTRAPGRVFAVLGALFFALTLHSGVVQWHGFIGGRLFARIAQSERPAQADVRTALGHLGVASRWGLLQPADLRRKLATLHIVRGGHFADSGRIDRAVSHFEAAIEQVPESALAHYNLGVISALRARWADAIDHYEAALPAAPSDPDLLNNLGFALIESGRLDEAEARLRSAIRLRPGLAHAHFNLSRVLQAQGRGAEAADHLETAAELDPAYGVGAGGVGG